MNGSMDKESGGCKGGKHVCHLGHKAEAGSRLIFLVNGVSVGFSEYRV